MRPSFTFGIGVAGCLLFGVLLKIGGSVITDHGPVAPAEEQSEPQSKTPPVIEHRIVRPIQPERFTAPFADQASGLERIAARLPEKEEKRVSAFLLPRPVSSEVGLFKSGRRVVRLQGLKPLASSAMCGNGSVKSFGRRQAYESPRGRNPRATVEGYGDFNLRLMSARARPQPGSLVMHADRPLRCASARFCRPGSPLAAPLSATMITTDACGSVAGGATPAVEVLTIPCRVMKPSPGSSPSHPAVRAAASSVRTSR